MLFSVGDYVTRNSHDNDMVFIIKDIKDDVAILEGINIRLVADSSLNDLSICSDCFDSIISDDRVIADKMDDFFVLDRDKYFYLPGKVLHIDADKSYLDRCMKFYNKMNVFSYGVVSDENNIHLIIRKHLEEVKPDVLVITGHDAFYDKNIDSNNMSNYKNSDSFASAVMEARKYEKDHEKLIIIAGACQSNYEELIKAGANFASSPKRINIHALDPAIIASSICLSNRNEPIDLINILERTKYGKDGIGGIRTNGVMYMGFPR